MWMLPYKSAVSVVYLIAVEKFDIINSERRHILKCEIF